MIRAAFARLMAWVDEEVRLAGLKEWSTEYHGPAAPVVHPCTASDPRCAATLEKMAAAREKLRRMKAGLLDGKPVRLDYFAHTDVAGTLDAIKRVTTPPVQLVRRRAK